MTDAEVAIAAVAAGADIVRRHFGSTLDRLSKGTDDFATKADIEAEQIMRALVHRERPDDGILGEEGGHSGSDSGERTWLLDPLCGTRNYAVRMQVVGVNAALSAGGRCRTAAVADPFTDDVFWTDGQSARMRRAGVDVALKPDTSSKLVDLNLDPPFPNGPAFMAATLAADEDFSAHFHPRVLSTTIALTWVATGQRAAYITDGDVRDKMVHLPPASRSAKRLGCTVTDLWGGAWGGGATGLVVGADAHTHAALLGIVRKYLP